MNRRVFPSISTSLILSTFAFAFASQAQADEGAEPKPASPAPPTTTTTALAEPKQASLELPQPSSGHGLSWKDPSLAFNLGMIQPLALGGANVEVDFRVGHFVASYSHGWSLDLQGSAVVGDMRTQKVALHLPYSTGFGVGYSFFVDSLRSFFDLRFEGKIHRFEASYDSADGQRRTAITNYTTYTVGGGFYWTLVPFAHRSDILRGLDISTSVRVWPNVGSSLSGGEIAYANATTGKQEIHKVANIGIADTPVVANVSLGYVFQ